VTTAAAGLCRLRFRAPEKVFELAVPTDVPLADLLPAIMGHAGEELEEDGLDHGGWVLQSIGADPLNEDRTAEGLGLHDGDELYLRPRRDALPPVHFDDLVDGVATGMRNHGDSWRPETTYRAAVAIAALALAGGLAVLALPGPAHLRALAAALTAAMLLLGAASASRAVADARAGTLLGAAAVPYAALAGLLLPAGGPGTAGARLLDAGSASAGTAVLAMAVVACSAPLFLGIVLVAVLVVVAGVLTLYGVSPESAAAIVVVVSVFFGAFVPGLSFRLAGLRLPLLPRTAEELQEDIAPFPAGEVLARSAVADAHLTSLQVALASACGVGGTLLALADGWAPRTTAAVLALLLVLHARAIGSLWQRLATLAPGVAVGGLLLARHALAADDAGRMTVLAGLLGATALLLVAAWTIPGRRLLPYWGRAADMLHTLAAISLFPLALIVAGAFHALRAISG
jgi:type VII secretion integral membrane protein EccD